ncbi:GatB/YqeY domain-containing protein [Proteiniclasticum sp. QWL-01]|uniref:GatB/YqeY domain-containing protein n=1 Tax=Proteiniclasticum sp. QWL-01 TaxID=3036945 RepID=UPI00220372DB|nr:GatB/YqeY domain-containing protein [Proteiniclasticum sp. QWL-01]UUM12576.1 GatB/YqeY domain-containing protein [Clostridiaceae bacterium HFYG-1003]WFF74132.1 GatB/YqeY domain-containing protein [Proteiniclasticum sp. QWL-01]
MTIKEMLQRDWIQAMKEKDKNLSNILNMAKAAILQVEKTDNRKVEDPEALQILAREIKQRREALTEFQRGNRQDLVDQANFEIETLLRYMPEQLTESEIASLIKEQATLLGANNIKDMGKLMGAVRPLTTGKADGKLVSELVKKYLNEQN